MLDQNNPLCINAELQDYPASLRPHALREVLYAARALSTISMLLHNNMTERSKVEDEEDGQTLSPIAEEGLLCGAKVLAGVIEAHCYRVTENPDDKAIWEAKKASEAATFRAQHPELDAQA